MLLNESGWKGDSATLKMQNTMYLLFLCAFSTAVLSDLPISVWAMINELPTQPQKYIGNASVVGFYWLKVFKYLFFFLTLVLSLIILMRNRPENRQLLVWGIALIATCLGPSIILRLLSPDIPHFLAGFKAWISLGAIAVGYQMTRQNWENIEDLIVNLLILNIAIAIMQQVNGYFACPVAPTGCLSIAEGYRSTGTFSEPNTLGAFGALGLLVAAIVRNGNPASLKMTLLCVVTLFFSGSRTAFLAAIVPLIYIYSREKLNRRTSPINSIVLCAFGLMIAGYLYSRGLESAWERFEILRDVLGQGSLIWGYGFGAGTLSIHTYSHLNPTLPIVLQVADSLYTSLLIQGGVWLFGTLCIVAMYTFFKLTTTIKICILVFLVMGLGMLAMEVWPFNMIVFSLVGWLLKEDANE